jgi:Tripartite tricarboxylate transporter family receptor
MRRRKFIGVMGAVVVWPLTARSQQPERVRRIGVLMGFGENDPEGTLWLSSFTRAFQEFGWADGGNIQMYVRRSHLCGETLKVLEGVDAIHIAFQGAAPALQSVGGGQVSMMCDSLSNVVQQEQSGMLKPIAVTALEPSKQLPDIPTSSQAGSSDLLVGNWYGFVAPSATPKERH